MTAAPQWTPKVGDTGLTRGGQPFEVLIVDERIAQYPVMALVNGDCLAYTADGRYYEDNEHDADLIAPTTKAFANVYLTQDGERGYIGVASLYASEEQALAAAELEKPRAEAVALRVEVPAWEA